MKNFLTRIKNPVFITAFTAFLYAALTHFGVNVDFGFYQQAVDIVCMALLGYGVYTNYPKKSDKKGE